MDVRTARHGGGTRKEMTVGWIIVQRWEDANDTMEMVVGHGNHIYKTKEEASHALSHLWKAWDEEIAKDPNADWFKHTQKPSLRCITWEDVVEEEAAGDSGAQV